MLTVTIPQKDGMDEYDYDPENPAVHIVDMSQNELEVPEDYTEEELTFYWSEEDYRQFLKELKEYEK